MSPELERFLEALYEKPTCPLADKAQRVATFERRPGDAPDQSVVSVSEVGSRIFVRDVLAVGFRSS